MKNKFIALLTLPLIMGAVTGCGNNLRESENEGTNVLTKEIIDANVTVYDESYSHIVKQVEKVFSDAMYKTASVMQMYTEGFIRFGFTDGDEAVYSLIKQDFVVPKGQYDTIGAASSHGNYQYIYTIKKDGLVVTELKYYDKNGNLVWEDAPGRKIVSIDFEYDGIYSEQYYNKVDFEDDMGVPHIEYQYYRDSKIEKKVVDVEPGGIPFIQQNGPFNVQGLLADFQPLEPVGLKDKYLASVANKVLIYNKEGKVEASYSLPNASGFVTYFNKSALCQEIFEVDEHLDYDYTESGKRYVVKTFSVDLMTGEITPLEVNYVIDSVIDNIYDEKGEYYKYSLLSVARINEDKTIRDSNENFVVDVNGKLHNNMSGLPLLSNLEKWGDYYAFYSGVNATFYNVNFDKVAVLNSPNIIGETGYMSFEDANGLNGIIDEKLNVVCSAIFKNISYQSDGTTIAAEKPNGAVGFYDVKTGKLLTIKEIQNFYDGYVHEITDYYVSYQKDETSELESYNIFNGEKFERTPYQAGLINDFCVCSTDWNIDINGYYGFDAAKDNAFVIKFDYEEDVPLLK